MGRDIGGDERRVMEAVRPALVAAGVDGGQADGLARTTARLRTISLCDVPRGIDLGVHIGRWRGSDFGVHAVLRACCCEATVEVGPASLPDAAGACALIARAASAALEQAADNHAEEGRCLAGEG